MVHHFSKVIQQLKYGAIEYLNKKADTHLKHILNLKLRQFGIQTGVQQFINGIWTDKYCQGISTVKNKIEKVRYLNSIF